MGNVNGQIDLAIENIIVLFVANHLLLVYVVSYFRLLKIQVLTLYVTYKRLKVPDMKLSAVQHSLTRYNPLKGEME